MKSFEIWARQEAATLTTRVLSLEDRVKVVYMGNGWYAVQVRNEWGRLLFDTEQVRDKEVAEGVREKLIGMVLRPVLENLLLRMSDNESICASCGTE